MSNLTELTVEADVVKVHRPSCPRCGEPIRLSFRYGDQIKAFHEDLISIKFEIGKDDISLYEKMQEKTRQELVKMKPIMKDCGMDVTLDKILALVEASSVLNRDQRWDLVYRIHLAYRLCCLVSDTKKSYVYGVDKKNKNTCTIREYDQAAILSGVLIALNATAKNPYSGSRYGLDLLNYCKLLDFQRQSSVIEAIAENTSSTVRVDERKLSKAQQLLQDLTDKAILTKLHEDDERYLVSWLDSKSVFFKVNLASSAKREIQLIQRLDMSSESCIKCAQPNCDAIFSQLRSSSCPEC